MDQPAPTDSSFRSGLILGGGLAVLLAVGVIVSRTCFGPAAASPEPQVAQPQLTPPLIPEPVTELPANLFRGWDVPEVAFLVTGQTFAYLQPCGCSEPQFGGLVRRYNLVKMLEKKGWKMAGIELGEIFPPKKAPNGFAVDDGVVYIPEQTMEKFKTTLRALEPMNYQDFGLGLSEFKMPLLDGLAQMSALNTKYPRPISLELKDPNKVFEGFSVRPYDVIISGPKGSQVKVAVSSLVGDSVVEAAKGLPMVDFFKTPAMIKALLPKLANEKVDFVVFLVHGDAKEAEAIAKLCDAERKANDKLPKVDLIVHTSDFDIAPARPQPIPGTDTKIIYPGHKGKDVGVLGLFRKPGGGFEQKYEFVQLGPEFKTPAAQAKGNPVIDILQDYAQTVKNRDFLALYKPYRTQHATQKSPILAGVAAKYVGSDTCGNCHAAEYKVWEDAVFKNAKGGKIGHSVGYQSLVDSTEPTLRQFDPECVACHVTGFKYDTGYFDPPATAAAKQIDAHNKKLLNVGCESCHGPGSMHANNPQNAAFYPLINPHKGIDDPTTPNQAVLADRFCQSCHDAENDVHWSFRKAWPKVRHTNLKNKGAAP